MGLAEMYPTMHVQPEAQAPARALIAAQPQVVESAPRRFIDIGVSDAEHVGMYPNSNHEKPAGYVEPGTEKTAAADEPASGAVSSPDAGQSAAQSPPTEEAIMAAQASKDPAAIAAINASIESTFAAAVPAEVKAQRAAEGNRQIEHLRQALNRGADTSIPGTTVIHNELANVAADHRMDHHEVSSYAHLARRLSVNPPTAEDLATWEPLTTPEEKRIAAEQLQRRPDVAAYVKYWNTGSCPQTIRFLNRAAQRRR